MVYGRKGGYKKYVPMCPLIQRECYKEACAWYVEKTEACSMYLISLHLYGLNSKMKGGDRNGMVDNADSSGNDDLPFRSRKSQSKGGKQCD